MTDRLGPIGRCFVAGLFLALALTACGGGGGGGSTNPPSGNGGNINPPGNGGGNNNPPPGSGGAPLPAQLTYSGTTTQATLDAQTSPVIAGAVLYELGLASASRPLPTGQTQKSRTLAKLTSKVANFSKTHRLAQQAPTTETCAGGGSRTVDDQTNDSGIGTLRISFSACIEEGITTDGVIVFDVAAYDLVNDVPTNFTATFYGYTERLGDTAIDLGGSVRSVTTGRSTTTTYNSIARYRPENVSYRLENMALTESQLPQSGVVSLLVQGRMYHSALGYVDVSTSSLLTLAASSITPSAGVLRMQGSASSSSNLTFMPASLMRLTLDEDGDGITERSMQVSSLAQLTLPNHRPVANAGPDVTIVEGQTATLVGSGVDWEGDPLTYEWMIVGGPVSSRVIGTASQVSFAPTVPGTYVIQLRITDLPPSVSTDTMTLVVTANADPVARAGADVSTSEGATVVLDGVASTDAENDPIQFSWALVSAPNGSTAPTSVAGRSWNFVPDRPGTYEYRLRAADAFGQSFDNVRITAEHLISFSFSTGISVDVSTTLASAQRSAPVNVSTHYSGTPIALSVSTNAPWLNVISSPANTGSGGNVVLGIVPAQVALLQNGTHTAQVTITPAGYTPRTVAIAMNLQLPEVEHVTPYVAYAGEAAPVTLFGSALQQTAGGTLLIDSAEVQGFTDSSQTRARISLPSLPLGEYELRVKNNLGIARASARFVVREPPMYPDGQVDILGRVESLEYDTERDAFYVVSWDLNYSHQFDAYRVRYDGAQWQRDALPVAGPLAVSLNVDGTRLYVTSVNCSVTELDPDTLAVLQTNTMGACYYERFGMIHGLADGRVLLADTNQWPTVYNYPAFTPDWNLLPSIHTPIDVLNYTRERLLWAESPTGSGPREFFIFDVATSSYQQVAVRDPDTYFLRYFLGISGSGRRFMHSGDVYEDGQYIGSLQGMGPYHLNPALTRDGERAVAFDSNSNRLSMFDLTNGPNFPLVTDLMTISDVNTQANILRILPNDSVAFLFSTQYVAQDTYVFRAHVRNLP